MLMFGDSNDRYIAADQCLHNEPHSHGLDTIKHCQHPDLSVSWQAMVQLSTHRSPLQRNLRCFTVMTTGACVQVGVHLQGPWWGGETGSPMERIEHGFGAYLEELKGDLDMVTFSSSLWDLERWSMYQPEVLAGGQIRSDLLQEWTAHLQECLTHIEVCQW